MTEMKEMENAGQLYQAFWALFSGAYQVGFPK